jgi:hypothetical protein
MLKLAIQQLTKLAPSLAEYEFHWPQVNGEWRAGARGGVR